MQYGRYETERELGRGSMGIVYQAHDPRLDRRVALKLLKPDLVSSETFVQRFLKEAKAAARLSHPNIVSVYDADEAQGTIYIAMEFLAGEPLDRLIKTKKLSENEIVHLGIQVARALDYAHQSGIVHRDIKPGNIILDSRGQIKITDFGIARIEDPSAPQQTAVGEVLGTPAYMSPEQALGKSVDRRTDIYSLGVVLYELSTGVRPFRGETLSAILMAIIHETPPEPERINASLSPELARIIMRCMSKVPEERFQTGEALAEALEKLGRRGESRPPVVPTTKKSPVRLGLFFVILLLVLGIGGGLSYHFLSKNRKARVERATAERIAPSQEQTKQPEGKKSESVSGLDEGKQKIDELERRIAAARIKQDEADKRAKEVEPVKPKAEQPQRATADVQKKHPAASSESSDSIKMEFVVVPKGRFILGSPGDESGRYQDEEPQHEVQITKPFYMGKYEVKVSEFREFVKATGYKTDAEIKGWAAVLRGKKWEKQAGLYWDNPGFSQEEGHPVTCVSWNDAVAFAKWMSKMTGHSYRLPTEAEWEYACRGGSKSAYSFGPDFGALGNYAWYLGNAGEKTHPVGQKNPNAWGLYDMHGNAREWCQDWYGDYAAGSVSDPVGPTNGSNRVQRGGSWGSGARDLRCAERKSSPPSYANGRTGFRLVRIP